MRRPPPEISDGSVCVHRKLVEKNFRGRGAVHRRFWALFKSRSPNLEKKKVFFSSKFDFSQVFSVNYSKNLEKKISKTIFRKKCIKSWRGGPRPKFLVTRSLFTETSWKKYFEVGGLLSTIWGLYFKSRNPKFLPSGKKRVFCVAVFFEIGNKNNSVVFSGRPNFFCIKTY